MTCKNRASIAAKPARGVRRAPVLDEAFAAHAAAVLVAGLVLGVLALVQARATITQHQWLRRGRETFDGMKRRSNTVRKARSPARSASSAKRGKPDAIDALVTAAAQALALPIDPAWRGGIRFNLQLLLTLAARVDEFPLPDDTEPAPVFHA